MAVGLVANQLANRFQALESRLSAVHRSQTSLKSGVDSLISEVSRLSYLFPGISHKDVLIFVIQQQARQAPKGSILLIGDSIPEGLLSERMGGLAVVNAGIGGAGVTTFRELVPKLAKEMKPSVVVIALGVNDARAAAGNETAAVARWSRDYQGLVQRAKRASAEPVLMTVLPVERDRPLGDKPLRDKYFNARQIKMRNKEIRRIATAEDVTLAEGFGIFSNGEGYGEKDRLSMGPIGQPIATRHGSK